MLFIKFFELYQQTYYLLLKINLCEIKTRLINKCHLFRLYYEKRFTFFTITIKPFGHKKSGETPTYSSAILPSSPTKSIKTIPSPPSCS